jgi:hypothetical protein
MRTLFALLLTTIIANATEHYHKTFRQYCHTIERSSLIVQTKPEGKVIDHLGEGVDLVILDRTTFHGTHWAFVNYLTENRDDINAGWVVSEHNGPTIVCKMQEIK